MPRPPFKSRTSSGGAINECWTLTLVIFAILIPIPITAQEHESQFEFAEPFLKDLAPHAVRNADVKSAISSIPRKCGEEATW